MGQEHRSHGAHEHQHEPPFEEQIAEWCKTNMAAYKAPRQIRFVDALPKTATGKVLKRILRDQAAALQGK